MPDRRQTSTTLAFHSSRIVVAVGVLIVMGAMSRSFVTSPGGNRSSLALDALPALLLVAPIFLVTLIPDHTRPLPRFLGWFALVLGLAAFPYAIVKYLDSSVLAGTLGGSVGVGAWLLVLGTLVTVAGIVLGMTRSAMGLASGGTPGRTRTLRARPASNPESTPARELFAPDPTDAVLGEQPSSTPREQQRSGPARPRTRADENPYGASPLFDSIEIPAMVDADKQGLASFEAEDATDRMADEDEA